MKFLGLDDALSSSRFAVLPVPYERTTSYVRGTAGGPDALLRASAHIEEFDEELLIEPCRAGIHTVEPVKDPAKVRDRVSSLISGRKTPVILGGEHSITPAVLPAFRASYKDLSVLQIDAHADLKDEYEGDRNSHACVMRRVLEVCPAVQAGIRSMTKDEYDFAKRSGQINKIHFAREMGGKSAEKIISQLSNRVYVTIDTDGLDPSVIPSTGTPEPGGLSWYDVLGILRAVASKKEVVGFDLVEFSPIKGFHAADYAAARLVYKMMGYMVDSR